MKTRHILLASVASLLAATTTHAQTGTFTDLTVNGLFQAKGPNNTNLISTDGGNVTLDFSGANGYLTLKGGDYDVAGFIAKPFDMATFYPATPNGGGPNGAFYFYDSYFTDGGVNKSVTDTYFTGDRNYGRWHWMTMVPGNGGYQSRMILQATGALELFTQGNQFTPTVSINPGNSGPAGITINGSQVLTQNSANSLYLTPASATAAFVGLSTNPGTAASIISPLAAIASGSGQASSAISIGNGASVGVESGVSQNYGGIAFGAGARSEHTGSIAIGWNSRASSHHPAGLYSSVALGRSSLASGAGSSALGMRTSAFGFYSSAVGYNSNAYGTGSLAFGYFAVAGDAALPTAGQAYAVAVGANAGARGVYSTAVGTMAGAFGASSLAVGHDAKAYGAWSSAIGRSSQANGFQQTVVGAYNILSGVPTATTNNADDLIFIVGNGSSETDRSNALTIRKDAGAALGVGVTSTAAGQVVVGKNNNTTDDATGTRSQGVFVVGAGTSSNAADRKNAIRVMDDGTVLIKPSGDLSMGAFTAGEQP